MSDFPHDDNDQAGSSNTRGRILEAALDLFARKGYTQARLDEIASTAGASRSAIFFHFPSKEKIFFALADRFADHLEKRVIEAIGEEAHAMRRVRVALETTLDTFGRYRKVAQILLAQGASFGPAFEDKREQINARFARLIAGYLADAVAQGQIPPTNIHVISLAWMGSINALVMHWVNTNEPSPQEILETLVPALLRSVGYGSPD
jgi:AcrR family transcriptional regulator